MSIKRKSRWCRLLAECQVWKKPGQGFAAEVIDVLPKGTMIRATQLWDPNYGFEIDYPIRGWCARNGDKHISAFKEFQTCQSLDPTTDGFTMRVQSDMEKIGMCRSMFTRFALGQELLRRNHGVPVLDQQTTLDHFVNYLNIDCRVPAEVIEMLQRMRSGSMMNNAGGTSGGRLQMSLACMNKEPSFYQTVLEAFFRPGTSSHYELFPSTTKSIEAFVSLLAHEAELLEQPIMVLLPSDAHYCWRNIMASYKMHPHLKFFQIEVGTIVDIRIHESAFVVPIFTLANTVSGRTTNIPWFQKLVKYVREKGATPHIFVDAALFGCTITRDTLDLRADAPPADVARLLATAFGIVQSGFKDYGLSSMLFLDDAPLQSCTNRKVESGPASTVAGGAHALIKHAPVTSIPESPTIAFLIFAREYTAFRRQIFVALIEALECAIPKHVSYEVRPLFPLLHIEFEDHELAAALTKALMPTYSLITIDAEPGVLRLWPTPTNDDIVDAIEEWFQSGFE